MLKLEKETRKKLGLMNLLNKLFIDFKQIDLEKELISRHYSLRDLNKPEVLKLVPNEWIRGTYQTPLDYLVQNSFYDKKDLVKFTMKYLNHFYIKHNFVPANTLNLKLIKEQIEYENANDENLNKIFIINPTEIYDLNSINKPTIEDFEENLYIKNKKFYHIMVCKEPMFDRTCRIIGYDLNNKI